MEALKNKTDIASTESFKNEYNRPKSEKKTGFYKVALIGNPNCGKTTLFNQLTGSRQYVGNWPGVTVDVKEGRLRNSPLPVDVVDLPGAYSLSPYSPEEAVARDYVVKGTPDLLINVVDATNLERNLYLTTQLLELDRKIVVALNMTDVSEKKGGIIDTAGLEKELGVPVVSISAAKNKGVDDLIKRAAREIESDRSSREPLKIYGGPTEKAISYIEKIITHDVVNSREPFNSSIPSAKKNLEKIPHARFFAVKTLEGNKFAPSELKLSETAENLISRVSSEALGSSGDFDAEILMADLRYKYIRLLLSRCVKRLKREKNSISQAVDRVAVGKFTAVPTFIALTFATFFLTFGPLGTSLRSWFEKLITSGISPAAEKLLIFSGASEWARSLALEAVIGGIGAIISFLPQILILFTLLSILEDCGYMARAAFITDKPMRRIGLSGRAFMPLLMGYGCSVPAILGTKILENEKDKKLTIFLIPFASCSAKTPVYMLFASTFFPSNQALAVVSLYLLGAATGALSAYLFGESLFKGEPSPFLMELPEYKVPSFKNLRMHVWDRLKDFVGRAGTVILAATIIIWFLRSFDCRLNFTSDGSQSMLYYIGSFIAPIFSVCGFGDWRASTSILTGLIAKESIVSTASVLYGGYGTRELGAAISNHFSSASASAFLTFVALYTPCVAAVSAAYKELKSVRLTAISAIYQFLIALFASAAVYQIWTLIEKIFS